MKNFFAAVFIMFSLSCNAFALNEQVIIDRVYKYLKSVKVPDKGEIDLRFGIDPLSGISYHGGSLDQDWDYSSVPNVGFSPGVEYIHPVSNRLSLGAGVQYLTPRQADGHQSFDGTVSYLPVYAVAQVNPLWFLPGVYLKFTAGYSFFFLDYDGDDFLSVKAKNNGFTWSAGAGIAITKNWAIDISYSEFFSKVSIVWPNYSSDDQNSTFSRLSVALMYRIRL